MAVILKVVSEMATTNFPTDWSLNLKDVGNHSFSYITSRTVLALLDDDD
jgi:hypothetical protein